MSEDLWQAFADSVELTEDIHPLRRPSGKDFDAFERATGFTLPRSYRAFVARFGPGKLGNDFEVAAPGNPKNKKNTSLEEMVARHRRSLAEDSAANAFADPARARRLVPFCFSELELRPIGWDPAEVTDPDGPEYAVYALARTDDPLLQVIRIADSFPDFIEGYVFDRFPKGTRNMDGTPFDPCREYQRR